MVLRLAWLAAAVVFFTSAAADEIVLKNGDRISGEIASKSDDSVVVRTGYANEVSIKWSEIATLSTTRVVEVLIEGESKPTRGTLQPVYGGGVLLVDEQGNARNLRLAQIAHLNPEAYEVEGRVAYSGRATLAANYTSGNVESERLYAEAALNARAKRYRYTLSGKTERRTDPVLGTVRSWLLATNYDRFLADEQREFVYGRASAEHDESKGIEQRTAVGGGYGVQVFDTARIRLTVRGGVDYVAVDRIGAENDRYPAAGWGLRLDYFPWGPKVELFHEQEGFWNLEDTDVVTLRSKTGVRVPLAGKLSASAQVNIDWERSPPPPRGRTDTVLLLGVDYTW